MFEQRCKSALHWFAFCPVRPTAKAAESLGFWGAAEPPAIARRADGSWSTGAIHREIRGRRVRWSGNAGGWRASSSARKPGRLTVRRDAFDFGGPRMTSPLTSDSVSVNVRDRRKRLRRYTRRPQSRTPRRMVFPSVAGCKDAEASASRAQCLEIESRGLRGSPVGCGLPGGRARSSATQLTRSGATQLLPNAP